MMYVLSGTVDGRRVSFPLPAGRHRVGRGSWNDIQLANPTVSREHAELVVAGNCVQVRDLSSRNGTWFRDCRLTDVADVHPGEKIRFGSLELSILQESPSDPGVTPQTLNLTSPDSIRAQECLDWSDIQSGLTRAPNIDPGLFRAVTEAGQLLAFSHSSREVFDRLLHGDGKNFPGWMVILRPSPLKPPAQSTGGRMCCRSQQRLRGTWPRSSATGMWTSRSSRPIRTRQRICCGQI